MYFFCLVFDLPNNGPIFPFKKHIPVSVSSFSSRMPMSNTNKELRRRSIYIKAYFISFGFKGEKSSCAESFSSNFSRKNVNMCTGSFPEVRKPCWPLWCKIWGEVMGFQLHLWPYDLWSQSLIMTFVLWQILTLSVSLDFYYLQQKPFPLYNQKQKSHKRFEYFFHQYSR